MEEEATKTGRIFVGGLGESVTSDDVHKVFSSLGKIQALEIIRTKGRSFAYIDFLPFSDKSLAKLFSTYNGCVWKGGRLRLEKAKEHYLDRLRHEWAQEQQQDDDDGAKLVESNNNNALHSDQIIKPNKLLDSKTHHHLNIFFPRSRKVKSLPFSGTGKHKYSFQRVDVPSLPMHFCDCEEHSAPAPAPTDKQKQVCHMDTQTGGMDEQELNIMNSVMKMLFQRENVSNTTLHTGTQLAKEGGDSIKSIDDLQPDESEADYTEDEDEDNLIINVVSRDNHRMALLGGRPQKTISPKQESRFSKKRPSKDGPIQKVLQEEKRDIVAPNKKRKSHTSRSGTPLGAQPIVPPTKKRKSCLSEESKRNELLSAISGGSGNSQAHLNESRTPLGAQRTVPESGVKQSISTLPWSQKSSWRALVGDGANSAFSVSDILPDTNKEEQPRSDCPNVPNSTNSKKQNLIKHKNLEDQWGKTKVEEALAEAQPTEPSATSNKSSNGSSIWFQKSSWTQLVSENNSSFSITQILPGITFEKQELIEPNSVDVANSTDNKHRDLVKQDKSDPARDGSATVGHGKEGTVVWSTPEKNQETIVENSMASEPLVDKKCDLTPKKTSSRDVSIGETCSFMRSTASLKQWANTKAAISRSHKRKVMP